MTQKKEQVPEEVKVERMQDAAERPYYSPLVDIYEEEDSVILVADMPGVEAPGVEVTCEGGILTITGRVQARVPENVRLLYQEYVPGDCHRCFRITEDVDVDAVKAKMSKGVLTVTLPKAKHARRKRIEVK